MAILCIYPADCVDGLGAAWAVHRALPDAEFVAAKYGEDPPWAKLIKREPNPRSVNAIVGRDVLIVGFSYPLATLRAMAAEARSVLVLDHHKTAREDLAELDRPIPWVQWSAPGGLNGRLATIFDTDRSGAGLTWDYLHPRPNDVQVLQIRATVRRKWDVDPDVIEPAHVTREIEEQALPRPRIIGLIEDRDLGRFKYGDESRAFHAVLASYDWTDLPAMFEMLDNLDTLERNNSRPIPDIGYTRIPADLHSAAWYDVMREGHAILRANRQLVAATVRASRRTIRIGGHLVPVACVPAALASDAGDLLSMTYAVERSLTDEISLGDLKYDTEGLGRIEDAAEAALTEGHRRPPFTATYYDGADGRRHFSLWSPEGGADVGAIAKQMAERLSFENEWILTGPSTFAGGGHPRAARFEAPLGWEGE